MRKGRRLYLIACSALVTAFVVLSGVQGVTMNPDILSKPSFTSKPSNTIMSRIPTVEGFKGAAKIPEFFLGVAQAEPLAAVQKQVCPQPPAPGSIVTNPPEIRNLDSSNPVNLTALQIASGQDCYLANGNVVAPTLRVNPTQPGKTIVLNLTNRLTGESKPSTLQNDCIFTGKMAPPSSTSLHFHGLNVSPTCHQDEVVKTVIKPNKTFNYKVAIPAGETPGLYWYHPHVHMQSEEQVLSGLTGAIIVEGIQKFNNRAAQLPERVFVLRDTPNNKQQCTYPYAPKCPPAKDISINSVPIRYLGSDQQGLPQYDPPAVIQMEPNQEQFWRVANTAADTYFDLQVTYDGTAMPLELVALDGVPINADYNKAQRQTMPVQHILLPPAGRAEFIIKGPGANVKDARFLTLNYDTGTQGDNDPNRTIARIDPLPVRSALVAATPATASVTESAVDLTQVSGDRFSGLSQTRPVKQRTLYFSEEKDNFYITESGQTPHVFDPTQPPDITVTEGDTENWIVENHTKEAHAFHIHQIHFLVLESPDSNEKGTLRDTINLPTWNPDPKNLDPNKTPYPHVKLLMDFRGVKHGSSIAGTFVYHCHILEHEDKGMMAKIQVKNRV